MSHKVIVVCVFAYYTFTYLYMQAHVIWMKKMLLAWNMFGIGTLYFLPKSINVMLAVLVKKRKGWTRCMSILTLFGMLLLIVFTKIVFEKESRIPRHRQSGEKSMGKYFISSSFRAQDMYTPCHQINNKSSDLLSEPDFLCWWFCANLTWVVLGDQPKWCLPDPRLILKKSETKRQFSRVTSPETNSSLWKSVVWRWTCPFVAGPFFRG